jgi:hypothetical protein
MLTTKCLLQNAYYKMLTTKCLLQSERGLLANSTNGNVMKQKIDSEVALLAIVSIISLALFLTIHSVEASGAISQINNQTGPAISVVRQPGNTTVTNSTNVIKIGLGVNPVITNGAPQTVAKALTLNSLKLGGAENANSQNITSVGRLGIGISSPTVPLEVLDNSSFIPTAAFDASSSNNNTHSQAVVRNAQENSGHHPINEQAGAPLGEFGFRGYFNGWEAAGAGIVGSASQNHTSTAQGEAIFLQTVANGATTPVPNFAVNQGGSVGVNIGKKICYDILDGTGVTTVGGCSNYLTYARGTGTQWFSGGTNILTVNGTNKKIDFGQSTSQIYPNAGIVIRNPASTFTTKLQGGAVTANQTLNLPAINGTDTLASLGKSQTFTQKQNFTQTATFNSGINTGGNIASTASSGTFKITAPSGVAICIGTGC